MQKTKISFDTREYNNPYVIELMHQRGIIRGNETIEDTFSRVLGTLIAKDAQLEGKSIDTALIEKSRELIENRTIAFGTPILAGVGRESETSSACTVIDVPETRGKVSWKMLTSHMTTMLSAGLGTGIDLSELDEPAEVLTELNEFVDELNIKLISSNKRPVACMATLRGDHPKIIDFIHVKKNANFNRWHFNISVWVNENLFSQKTDPLLLNTIVESAHYCAEPGILFFDRYNRDNPTPDWTYSSVAPCGEIAMASGEACQFSYINLSYLVKKVGSSYVFDWEQFIIATKILTRLLDSAVQMSGENSGLNLDRVLAKRRIGVGITGFAGLLINLHLPYASDEAKQLAQQISETLDYYTKQESVQMAKKRGRFPIFQESLYTQPTWIERKQQNRELYLGQTAWVDLNQSIINEGIRNASTSSFAPTGTSSRIVRATPQFEPCYDLSQIFADDVLMGRVAKILSAEQVAELQKSPLTYDENHVLGTARRIHYKHHIEMQAAFQSFADDATSKTINLPQDSTVDDVMTAMRLAFERNLKGLTVFRDGCLDERDPTQIDSGHGID